MSRQQQQQQLLVRFENHRTLVIDLDESSSLLPAYNYEEIQIRNDDFIHNKIKERICLCIGGYWHPSQLQVTNLSPPFCNVRIRSCIRGGKGGFGTLLKGQSRQASANTTKDFSSCRDLQGRRLRHVNDAVNYTVWKEWKDKVDAGTATLDEMAAALINTDSGIAGWHLQLPAWAEVSVKKERQRMKKLLRTWKKEQDNKKAIQRKQIDMQERQIASYVQDVENATAKLENTIASAISQGLKRKEEQEKSSKRIKTESEPPIAFLTLTGDAILAQENDKWRIQSQSNFCTVAIVLDPEKLLLSSSQIYYWEVCVISGGLVQIGWATPSFQPESDNGDGVGDCIASWAYDGSRSIKLHGEKTESYGESWKSMDVIGCLLNQKDGQISYRLNGKDLGIAYEGLSDKKLFPAISCNPGEIVELRLNRDEMEYQPSTTDCTVVGDILASDDNVIEAFLEEKENLNESNEKQAATTEVVQTESNENNKRSPSPKQTPTVVTAERLDLDEYKTIEDLEKLGLDRLKSALMAEGLKCGGTLHERALRLQSIRGLKPDDYPKKLLAKKR